MTIVRRLLYGIGSFLLCAVAVAQQRPIFDPDDFIDPRERAGGAVFFSRIVMGGAWSFIDDHRPLADDITFVHLTNSLYWQRVQLDYKRSELRGGHPPVRVCACDPPVFFPTPPPPDATPAAPPPGSKDMLQFAWYYDRRNLSGAGSRVMLRVRGSWMQQSIQKDVLSPVTGQVVSRISGREQSFGLEGDTYFRIRRRDLFGTIQLARTTRSGPTDHRRQTEFTYSHRFPAVSLKDVLFRTIVTVGGVSGRAGTAINVVNPYFEAFLHESRTRANFHLVYSPQFMNSGAEGWKAHHQIALFADRALFVKLFR